MEKVYILTALAVLSSAGVINQPDKKSSLTSRKEPRHIAKEADLLPLKGEYIAPNLQISRPLTTDRSSKHDYVAPRFTAQKVQYTQFEGPNNSKYQYVAPKVEQSKQTNRLYPAIDQQKNNKYQYTAPKIDNGQPFRSPIIVQQQNSKYQYVAPKIELNKQRQPLYAAFEGQKNLNNQYVASKIEQSKQRQPLYAVFEGQKNLNNQYVAPKIDQSQQYFPAHPVFEDQENPRYLFVSPNNPQSKQPVIAFNGDYYVVDNSKAANKKGIVLQEQEENHYIPSKNHYVVPKFDPNRNPITSSRGSTDTQNIQFVYVDRDEQSEQYPEPKYAATVDSLRSTQKNQQLILKGSREDYKYVAPKTGQYNLAYNARGQSNNDDSQYVYVVPKNGLIAKNPRIVHQEHVPQYQYVSVTPKSAVIGLDGFKLTNIQPSRFQTKVADELSHTNFFHSSHHNSNDDGAQSHVEFQDEHVHFHTDIN